MNNYIGVELAIAIFLLAGILACLMEIMGVLEGPKP
jgi:hypothetical protein